MIRRRRLGWVVGAVAALCLPGCDAFTSSDGRTELPTPSAGGGAFPSQAPASPSSADVVADVTLGASLKDCGCFGDEHACLADAAAEAAAIPCFEDAANACEGAKVVELGRTTEGGLIVLTHVSLPASVGCGVVVVHDATDDVFGNCQLSLRRCAGVASPRPGSLATVDCGPLEVVRSGC